VNTFGYFGRTLWKGDHPIVKPLPTQDSTTQKNVGKYQCLEWDSNPWSQYCTVPCEIHCWFIHLWTRKCL